MEHDSRHFIQELGLDPDQIIGSQVRHSAIEALSKISQDQLAQIVQKSQFQEWMGSLDSEAIFVNCPSSAQLGATPAAYLCNELTNAISHEQERILSLKFSCGEHRSASDPQYGATGVLRGLITQLLLQLPQIDTSSLRKPRKNHNSEFDILCSNFESLICELAPEVIIFCAIEDINVQEENERLRDGFEDVVEFLVELTELRGRSVFKLLIVCSWNSRHLWKQMPDPQRTVLWIPSSVPSQGGMTATRWKAFLEKHIRLLV